MATKVLLLALVLSQAVGGEASASLTLNACTNAWVHLTCRSDEKLQVTEVRVTTTANLNCQQLSANGPLVMPAKPSKAQHLCNYTYACMWREDICEDKSECLFFVGSISKDTNSRNRMVSIQYGCKAGASRIGGIAGILIVTILLVAVMILTTCMICRKSGVEEDGSKYVEFENRLSRTPSMSSEKSAKAVIKSRFEAEGPFGGDDLEKEKQEEKQEEAKRQSTLSSTKV